MKISASQAAKAANVSGSTISRAIKSGKLSALQTDDKTGWLIDPAELDRWRSNRAQGVHCVVTQWGDATPATAMEPTAQEVEIRMLREMLAEMKAEASARIARSELEADHWREQAMANLRLAGERQESGRWWNRIWGKDKAA